MLTLRIIFIIQLLTISYIHSEIISSNKVLSKKAIQTVLKDDVDEDTTDITLETTTTVFHTSVISNEAYTSDSVTVAVVSTDVPVTLYEETQQTTAQLVMTTVPSKPLLPVFSCDFNSPCFGGNELRITNGSEFNYPDITDFKEPPRAPLSDANSINRTTINNLVCALPYKPKFPDGNTTEWDMWFCYKNQCPTVNGPEATCQSGSYGILDMLPSVTSQTVTSPLINQTILRDSDGNQCLRFYYYFTTIDGDIGQNIEISILPNNESTNLFSIRNLTFFNMKYNRWEFEEIEFKSATPYTINFTFNAGTGNETIYFALDELELYSYNCSYVNEQTVTIPPVPTTTTTTTTTTTEALPPTTSKSQLALILGLSLGIGIPVLLGILLGIICYCKASKSAKIKPKDESASSNNTTSKPTDIPMVSTTPRKDKKNVAPVSV